VGDEEGTEVGVEVGDEEGTEVGVEVGDEEGTEVGLVVGSSFMQLVGYLLFFLHLWQHSLHSFVGFGVHISVLGMGVGNDICFDVGALVGLNSYVGRGTLM
jgi:hypothetical protein